jgi:outer membrane immunogenic protein
MAIRKSLALAMAVAGMSGPAVAGAAYPPLRWDGFHAGPQGGDGWGQQSQSGGRFVPSIIIITICTSFCDGTGVADGSYKLSGGLVGGTVGYDWQNGRYVFGLEGDGSWADISGSGTCGFGGVAPHPCGGSVRALGTVRARLGYDLGNVSPWGGGVLAYATGGLAVGDVHAWDSLLGTSGDKTAAGWTVGAGLEAMFAPNWSVKLEYLHVDLGNPAVFTAIPPNPEHVSTHFDVVRLGLNYHFSWTPAPTPPVVTKTRAINK